jgi:hypothetical protein
MSSTLLIRWIIFSGVDAARKFMRAADGNHEAAHQPVLVDIRGRLGATAMWFFGMPDA